MRRLIGLLIALGLGLASGEVTAQGRRVFQGGPLDGVGVGEVVRPDNGVRIVGLLPSAANASPVPQEDQAAINAFISAFQSRDFSRLEGFLARRARQQICPRGFSGGCDTPEPLEALRVVEDCTFNTPYYLGNHTVRLEWLYQGALWYWSIVSLERGRIRSVRTYRADVPPGSPR